MMDASSLFPKGFHPSMVNRSIDLESSAKCYSRSAVSTPVRYYYIDFGISSRFEGGERSRLVLGMDCLDKDVPELSYEVPYDPFKVDIFVLGNFFDEVVQQVRGGI